MNRLAGRNKAKVTAIPLAVIGLDLLEGGIS